MGNRMTVYMLNLDVKSFKVTYTKFLGRDVCHFLNALI